MNLNLVLADIPILRATNSSQYQQSSQAGARSARHSLRPQTSECYEKGFVASYSLSKRGNSITVIIILLHTNLI